MVCVLNKPVALLRPTLLIDKKKSDGKPFCCDNDHKLKVIVQKKTFSDHFFLEEALSEEQLVRKFGKNGRSYQKKY